MPLNATDLPSTPRPWPSGRANLSWICPLLRATKAPNRQTDNPPSATPSAPPQYTRDSFSGDRKRLSRAGRFPTQAATVQQRGTHYSTGRYQRLSKTIVDSTALPAGLSPEVVSVITLPSLERTRVPLYMIFPSRFVTKLTVSASTGVITSVSTPGF